MTTRRYRGAGSDWRLLVHGRGHADGLSYDVISDPGMAGAKAKTRARLAEMSGREPPYSGEDPILLPSTEFDELVVGGPGSTWLHIEQQDTGVWWMSVAGIVIHVRADKTGRPKWVTVQGPGDYDDAVEGCRYDLLWSRENDTWTC